MSVGSAAVWAMAGQYATFAIMFATSVIISRFFLDPAEVGLFSIALAAALLLAVLQDFGLTRYIAGLERLTKEEINRCSSIALIFAFGIAVLIAALAWPLSKFYAMPELAPLLVIIAGSYLFVPLSVVPMALMGREMRFSGHFAVNVGGAAVHAAVALGLAALGFSAFSLAWATLLSALAKGLIAQSLCPARPLPLRLDGLRPIVAFGGKTSTLYITDALGTRTPDLIVGKIVGLVGVGLFSRATSLADQFRLLIAGAIGSVFYPTFARIRDSGQPLGPAYLRVCAGYSALVLPSMAALSLASHTIVMLLFGPEWIGTAPLLTLVAIQSAVMICLPMVTELPILTGHIHRLIVYNIVQTAMSVGLLILGSYLYGATGAAASRVVFALCFLLLYMRFISSVVGFAIGDWCLLMGKSILVTLATVSPILLSYALWTTPDAMTFVQLLACTAAGAVLWLAALVAVRHPALQDMVDTAQPILNRTLPFRVDLQRLRRPLAGERK